MVSFKKRSCTVLHHQKTALLVQQHTTSSAIEQTLDVYVIDDATLKKIDTSKASDTEKVFNLIKIIEKTVEQQGVNAAYLVSIAEKAELIVILHELLHLKYPNHGKMFTLLMDTYLKKTITM